MSFWIGISLVILTGGLVSFLKERAKSMRRTNEVERRMEERLAEIERRLTDIQDVVISIDEKLSTIGKIPT